MAKFNSYGFTDNGNYKKRSENIDENIDIYGGVQGHLLNTFFSGLYISSAELLQIGREMGFNNLSMTNRELLISEILSQAKKISQISLFARKLSILIDRRISEYRELVEAYPKGSEILLELIQKAISTKKLLLARLRD